MWIFFQKALSYTTRFFFQTNAALSVTCFCPPSPTITQAKMAHISTWQLQRKLVPAEMEEPELDPIKNSSKRRKTEKSASAKVKAHNQKKLRRKNPDINVISVVYDRSCSFSYGIITQVAIILVWFLVGRKWGWQAAEIVPSMS